MKSLLNNKNIYILYLVTIFFLISFTIYLKVKNYDYNLSSLINLDSIFVEKNNKYIPDNFVILKNTGYDGQFFFFTSYFLYNNTSLPYYDSSELRFSRILFPLFTGFISKVFGFSYYPQISLIILLSIHIIGFHYLFKFLPDNKKYLSYLYLFSPFSINSMLLLVSDSLYTSFLTLTIIKRYENSKFYLLFGLLAIFTKETGIILLISLLFFSNTDKGDIYTLVSIILLYGIFRISTHYYFINHKGISPLGFMDLMDYPFLGLINSIKNFSIAIDITNIPKLAYKLSFLILLIYLVCIHAKIFFFEDKSYLNISLICLLGIFSEQGYWLNYDNISRIFTASIPILILYFSQSILKHKWFYYIYFIHLIIFIIRCFKQNRFDYFIY
jgi:hypothetical protein